jgi:hypothetical protein
VNEYTQDIEQLLEGVPFGELQLSIKRHGGKVVGLVVNTTKSEKYAGNNSLAAAHVLQTLKDAAEVQMNGALTFTVTFNQGQITRIVRQGYTQKNY